MFNLGIYIKVKFRALFIDFGTVEKAFTVGVNAAGSISEMEIDVSQVPPSAKKLLDKRGILLKVW